MGRNRMQEPIGNKYQEFGQRLKELRNKRGMTQEELASEMNISKTSIVNYEMGTRKVPLEFIIKFAEFFKVSIDELAGVNFTSINDDAHVVLSTNPNVIRTTQRWREEMGDTRFTEEEMDELIKFAKYLIYSGSTSKYSPSKTLKRAESKVVGVPLYVYNFYQ